jgi:serine/threonine protein phosphatase 1
MSLFRRLFQGFSKPDSRRARIKFEVSDFSGIYAVGDIHGCIGLLNAAYDRILLDASATPGKKLVVFLGDYVDRGPDSKAVIDFLSRPPSGNLEHICLCGNHDDEFLTFLRNPKGNMGWLGFGGAETLRSYGVDAQHIVKSGGGISALERIVKQAVPAAHADFLAALPIMVEIGSLVFVHAGVRPGLVLEKQKDQDLMWIREPFLTLGPDEPWLVVHGHTVEREPAYGRRRIGIDTGAVATGRLTVLGISQGKASILQ